MTRPKVTAVAAGSALLLLGTALWCTRTPPVPVAVESAQVAPLAVEVSTNGRIEPVPEAELRVHARLDGRIRFLPEPGTVVAAGQPLLEIDAAPAASELAGAESEQLAAQEALRTARRTLESVERRAATDAELFAQGALTAERHAESRAGLASARERLANLEREVPLRTAALAHRIAELREQTAGARVLAPFSGTVYRTERRAGEVAVRGEPLLWLADLSRLRVRANIDQVDLGRVRVGQRLRIGANAWPGRSWSAVVSEIVPHVVVKENRSVAEGIGRVEPPSDGLVPGMTVDVDVVVADRDSVLQVPATAVHREDGAPFVYVVRRGRAQRTPVELGLASIAAVEVRSGLEADTPVVVSSENGLRDGTRVEPRTPHVAGR